MGSFADTCCISGLPIEAGDPVRYFLLTQNPYCDGGFVCEMYGRWVPRTWPIKAEYNDYGSIENWEKGPLLDVIMRGFQEDLVEVGVGDNSVHDVSAKKDMSFEELLEAVWEGRVSVARETGSDGALAAAQEILGKPAEPVVEDWRPTLRSVEAVLAEAKLPENSRYLVDEQPGAGVRVRWDGLSGDYGKDVERLTEAKALLERRFAVVMTAGSGSYSHSAELRCFIAPGKREDGHDRRDYSGLSNSREKPLLIQQAMIREDVWQQLLALKVSADWGRSTHTIDDYRKSARGFLEDMRKRRGDLDKLTLEDLKSGAYRRLLFGMETERAGRDSVAAFLVSKEIIPFSIGLHAHAKYLLDEGKEDEAFADLVAEFSFIWRILGEVRYVFRPSDTAGPQFGEYKAHTAFLRAMVKASLEAKKSQDR